MANKPQYTDEQIDEFIETAQMSGIAPAIRLLGFPTYPTAQKWFKMRDLEMPTVDSLMAKAAELKVFYGDNEKKASLQIAIDRIVEELQENADLDADGINKLANALSKLLQTYQLIEGKSTQITDKKEEDFINDSVKSLVDKMNAKNAETKSAIQ